MRYTEGLCSGTLKGHLEGPRYTNEAISLYLIHLQSAVIGLLRRGKI
jgi:hypothetical protein